MNNFIVRTITAIIGGGIIIGSIMYSASSFLIVFSIIGILALYEAFSLLKKTDNLRWLVMTSVYVMIGFYFFINIPILHESYNPLYTILLLVLIWSNDTGAYLVGKNIGKTKLWESVSPNKTWEGFAGGLVVACLAGFLYNTYFNLFETFHIFALSFIAVVFGTGGDLIESAFKRYLKVKDSGNIIPGHGGILDRFDSLLLAAPLFYFYIKLVIVK